LYRVLYSNFRALIILNFIDKLEIFIKGSNKDNILWKKNVAFALRLRIMIMKNKEIMRIWTCACMLNAWEREREEKGTETREDTYCIFCVYWPCVCERKRTALEFGIELFLQWTEDMLRIVPRHVLKLQAKTRVSSLPNEIGLLTTA